MAKYKINHELCNGARLELLLFDKDEHRWIFKHRYVKREGREKPDVVNDVSLIVDYQEGIVQGCSLDMNIVRPKRLGKKYYLGADISPDSKLFVQFSYIKEDNQFRMSEIDLGRRVIDLDSQQGLIQPVEFPFPLKDRIKREHGIYRVPFLRDDGTIANFEFPECYRRS